MTPKTQIELDRSYLPFDPRRAPVYEFDVLVVGSGAAGSSAALAAAEAGAEVAILAKASFGESNTVYAQGGLAAVLDPSDSFQAHVADTLRVGCGLSHADVASRVVHGAPEAVDQLLRWGACFDRTESGELDLGREGGHGFPRILHSGDATGVEIQRVVQGAVEAHPRISGFPETFVVDLLERDARVVGLSAVTRGRQVAFVAREVVLATGGAGQVFRETTNPTIATGDGVALGLRAGAVARDLEFIQFHPTCLYIAGAARVLISEIVRGAGGVLRDKNGVPFMKDFHPDAELAPRDVVSRAAFDRMVRTADTNVYLDLSDIAGDPHRLFPGISRICRHFGIDIATDPIPVRPGAHYSIGGLAVDADGRSTVDGLWAVGECASSGLHGANRMGSNSLLECLVLGTRAGARAAERARSQPASGLPARGATGRAPSSSGIQVNIQDLTYSLKSLMWRQLGVVRSEETIADALEKIAFWMRTVRELAPAESGSWQLMNMLTVAHLTASGAREREESRGVHFRSDFPEQGESPFHNEFVPRYDGALASIEVRRAPVPGPAEDLVTV